MVGGPFLLVDANVVFTIAVKNTFRSSIFYLLDLQIEAKELKAFCFLFVFEKEMVLHLQPPKIVKNIVGIYVMSAKSVDQRWLYLTVSPFWWCSAESFAAVRLATVVNVVCSAEWEQWCALSVPCYRALGIFTSHLYVRGVRFNPKLICGTEYVAKSQVQYWIRSWKFLWMLHPCCCFWSKNLSSPTHTLLYKHKIIRIIWGVINSALTFESYRGISWAKVPSRWY